MSVPTSKDRATRTPRWPEIPIQIAGAALITLGILVLLGWTLGNARLVQAIAEAPPMRADLALAFVLCGLAVTLVPTPRERLAQFFALTALLVALFAAAKHGLRRDQLPLDHLFSGHPSAPLTPYTSRMTLSAALYLSTGALALIAVPLRATPAFVLGMMTAILGLVSIAGSLLVGRTPQWETAAGTAVPSAIGFVVLGGAVTAEALRRRAKQGRGRIEPYLVGLVTAAGAVVFWQSLVHQENLQVERLVAASAVGIRSTLADSLSDLTSSLEVFAAETDRLEGDMEAWDSNVTILLANHPSLTALWWLNGDGTSRAIEWNPKRQRDHPPLPPDAEERARLSQNLRHRSRRAVIGTIAPPGEASEHGSFRVLAPVRRVDHSDLLLAEVDLSKFASDALDGIESESAVTIYADKDLLFRSLGTASRAERRTVGTRSLELRLPGGGHWKIVVGPSATQIASRSAIPAVALLAGLVISALLVSALNGSERERNRAHELADALRRLEFQARQLRDTERRLRDLNDELERRVAERTTQLSKANAVLEQENRLRRRAQMRLTSANQHLREFDAFISHELRQPLAAMRLWVDLLESAAGQLSEKHRGYAGKISVEIRRMSELIENELTLSKASDANSAVEPVPLGDVIADLEQSLAPRLAAAGASLHHGELPVILGDSRQMRQLFLNLIDNAIKYRRDDVPLRVEVRPLSDHDKDFIETYGDEYCEIVVTDNGRGISAEHAGEIFEIFRRVGNSSEVAGSGVGLAICRRIAERHDGTIFANGALGEGARFHVVLPLADPPGP